MKVGRVTTILPLEFLSAMMSEERKVPKRNWDESADREQPLLQAASFWFSPSSEVRSISDRSYFDVIFTAVASGHSETGRHSRMYRVKDDPTPLSKYQENGTWPKVWLYIDGLAKAAASTTLADLGQNGPGIDMLDDAATLQSFTSRFKKDFWHKNDSYVLIWENAKPGRAQDDYDALKDTTGPLGISPSVISAQYICSVPRRKSTGDLIISILVADLVFLQLSWTLFTMIIGWTALRRVPQTECCEGCSRPVEDATPLIGATKSYQRLSQGSQMVPVQDASVELSPMRPAFDVESASKSTGSTQDGDRQGLLSVEGVAPAK